MNLTLIRHGTTMANEQHLYCGSTDLPLSEAGRNELKTRSYVPPANARFVTSGMKRTNETLHILFGDIPFTEDPRFREVDFGVFEMHSYEELKDRADYQQWLNGDNECNIPPNGESGVQMTQRVLEALATLPEHTVLVTHGGVIAAIMQHCFPQEGKTRYEWQPKNGGGYFLHNDTYRILE